MATENEIEYAGIGDLYLDPNNVRLGRHNIEKGLSQAQILDLMRDWTLDELAISFRESGFWAHEALLVVREPLGGQSRLVVVEGNRRLAALKFLYQAVTDKPASRTWGDIADGLKASDKLFTRIPYILVSSREKIEAFLGFRHVTGIKEWDPAEKAQFIAKMIEERGMTYEEVMRKIGSKTSTVRQHYISYRLLLQMEEQDTISLEHVEEKFSVLYLSLRADGVQKYLHINIQAPPSAAKRPVPRSHLRNLTRFALWLFGDKKRPPIVTDSRQVDDFGRMLESKQAIAYLERADSPNFETAFRIAGGDEAEISKLIHRAADNIELALSRSHLYPKSKEIQAAVARFWTDANQLIKLFPQVVSEVRATRA
jgi:hypothetical protein